MQVSDVVSPLAPRALVFRACMYIDVRLSTRATKPNAIAMISLAGRVVAAIWVRSATELFIMVLENRLECDSELETRRLDLMFETLHSLWEL